MPKRQRNLIYQVHCGRWQQANVLDHPGQVLARLLTYNWKKLKSSLGVSHIYLMGIWENDGKVVVNEENNIDLSNQVNRTPSPFAISNHLMINKELGTTNDMDRLLTCLHGVDLEVIVDFVPNHTGLDHPWIADHPDYYKLNSQNMIQTAFSGDVAELNYDNPNVVKEMGRVLEYIASFGFDGVRCDMAHLIPLSFWSKHIGRIKEKFPNFSTLAEAYSESVMDLSIQTNLMQAGFDAVYDEPLYRNLNTGTDHNRIDNFIGHFNYVLHNYPQQWLHYVSNHDDNFLLPSNQLLAWTCLTTLLPGWMLLYNGSLWGRRQRLAHHFVELLSAEDSDIDALDEKTNFWFKWLSETNPLITNMFVDDELVTICWEGNISKGHIWCNLTNRARLVKLPQDEKVIGSETEELIEPYQLLVSTKA